MTQEERIAEARITEERNKQLLQKFIDMEKERKKNARSLLKTSKPLTGPFIRFLSKRVNESVDQRLFSAEKDSDQGGHAAMDGKEAIENVHDADNGSSDELSETLRENVAQNNKEALEGDGASADNGGAAMDMATMRENDDESISIHFDDRQSEELSNKEERNPIEDVSGNISRNYIILEGFPEPFDLDKQKNILFSHADPPIEPKKNRCLITGKTARYKDPVSGLYYSDLSAYQTICRIIRGDIPWSPIACTFVAILRPASGVPRNFHDSQPFQGE